MKEMILAYKMQVNEKSGVVYQGYLGLIENTLEAKQRFVNFGRSDGTIQVLSLTDDIDLIIHDEGKLLNFPLNRFLVDDDGGILDAIAGNILAVRHDGEDFISIRQSDIPTIEKYLKAMKIVGFSDIEFIDPADLTKLK